MRKLTSLKSGVLFVTALLVAALLMSVAAQTTISNVEPGTVRSGDGGNISVYGSGFTNSSVVRLTDYGLLTTTYINDSTLMAALPTNLPPRVYVVEVRDPAGDTQWSGLLNVLAPIMPTNEPLPTMPPPPTAEPVPLPSPVPGEPRLTARGYNVVPGAIKPGDGLVVTFEIVNLGNRAAQSVIATLDSSGKFLPGGSMASLTVPDLPPNGTYLASLSVIGARDLPAGPAVIPIKLSYRDFEGKTFDTSVSFSVNVEAIASSTQLTISEYMTLPDPVEPGSPTKLQVVVTNSGSVVAPGALLKIGGAESVLFAGPQGDTFPLGDLAPGASVSINAELVVRANASAGPQQQPYTLSYTQGAEVKETTGTLTLNVAQVTAPAPLLLLENYSINIDTLKPGDSFTLKAKLVNVGSGDAQNLVATFGTVNEEGGTGGGTGGGSGTTTTPSSTFAPLGTGGSIFIGTLKADGGERVLEQDFIVSGSTKSGVYSLPITLRYPNAERQTVTTSLNISLIVVVPPELRFADGAFPTDVFVGEPANLSLMFTNLAKTDVNIRSATVTAENGEVIDGGASFIGTVPAAEDGMVNAMVMPLEEGPVTVTVTINYIDELNQQRQIVRTFESIAMEAPPMPTDDPFLPTPPPVTPEPTPAPTFSEILGRGLMGMLGLGS